MTLETRLNRARFLFAWFQTSGSVSGDFADEKNAIVTAQDTYGDGLTAVLEYTNQTLDDIDATGPDGIARVWNAQHVLVPLASSTPEASDVLNLSFKVGESAATVDTLKQFEGNYTLTVTGTSQSKRGEDEEWGNDDPSRLKLANVETKAKTSDLNTLVFDVTIANTGYITVAAHTGQGDRVVAMNVGDDHITASTTVYIAIDGGAAGDEYAEANVDSAIKGTFDITFEAA